MEQSLSELLVWYAVGFLGVMLHVMVKALKLGRTLSIVWQYTKANNLPIVITLFMYTGLVLYWVTEGLSILGMIKGQLTGLTFIVGYMANSIFRELVEKRVKKNLENMQSKENGGT